MTLYETLSLNELNYILQFCIDYSKTMTSNLTRVNFYIHTS